MDSFSLALWVVVPRRASTLRLCFTARRKVQLVCGPSYLGSKELKVRLARLEQPDQPV
jgi:hypothetical protein